MINSFRPDVYAQSGNFEKEIIGEAKTPKDIDTIRSMKQLEAFLYWCSQSRSRALILATQWDYVRYANSTLKYLCKRSGISTPNFAIQDQFGNITATSNDWI
jgi:hypothetical protein